MEADWIALTDLDAFRAAKRRSDGLIVIRGAETKVHHPDCPHVTEDGFLEKLRNGRHAYHWAPDLEVVRAKWIGAKLCRHPSDPLNGGTGGAEVSHHGAEASTAERSATTFDVAGPSQDLRAVRAAADRPLPYEPRLDEEKALRTELRTRLRRLVTRPDEILHAAYFGPKAANADVENILIYNVDDGGGCFVGGQSGVRFEWSPRTPAAAGRPAMYLYRPVPRTAGFTLWSPDASRATTLRASLPAHPKERLRTWLALRTGDADLRSRQVIDENFVASIRVRPPGGLGLAADGAARLVKPLLDAFVAALQTDGEAARDETVVSRLAAATSAPAEHLVELLVDDERAVLGRASKLMRARSEGLQLSPSDERCVGAEVLVEAPRSDRWEVEATVMPTEPRGVRGV